ncbi:MAG: cyclic nucleotide-binding domain-containing protein [Proteobacteria bacterium]|nr:cyclic nucleotide-binding domain-containing protein [Pseudomonadota bacterium]
MEFGDAVKVLRSIPMFAKVDPSKLKLLAFASEYLTFDDGEDLCREGDHADTVFLIYEGEVDVIAHVGDTDLAVAKLGQHALVGEMAIFRNTTRSATLRAHGRVGVLSLSGDMFVRLVTENPDAAMVVMRILSEKIAQATQLFEDAQVKLNDGSSSLTD